MSNEAAAFSKNLKKRFPFLNEINQALFAFPDRMLSVMLAQE